MSSVNYEEEIDKSSFIKVGPLLTHFVTVISLNSKAFTPQFILTRCGGNTLNKNCKLSPSMRSFILNTFLQYFSSYLGELTTPSKWTTRTTHKLFHVLSFHGKYFWWSSLRFATGLFNCLITGNFTPSALLVLRHKNSNKKNKNASLHEWERKRRRFWLGSIYLKL